MSLNNWYPFYVGDYMRDTAMLSILEHGAYRLLLDHYYSTGNPLPDDEKQLHRICRAFDEQEQKAINKILQLFFLHDANAKHYTHKKVEKELAKKGDISRKRAQAARNKGKYTSANAEQMQSKCIAIDDTSTSTSTSTSKDNTIILTAFDGYNSMAKNHGLAVVQKLTETRKTKLSARLRDCGGIDGWNECLKKVGNSEFLTGSNKNGWKADFDFIVTESKFTKIMEGSYDNKKQSNTEKAKLTSQIEDILENGW